MFHKYLIKMKEVSPEKQFCDGLFIRDGHYTTILNALKNHDTGIKPISITLKPLHMVCVYMHYFKFKSNKEMYYRDGTTQVWS